MRYQVPSPLQDGLRSASEVPAQKLSSMGSEPIEFMYGIGMLIPGLESQLEGKEMGYKDQLHIVAKDAYGERNEEAMHTLPKSGFRPENDEELIVGMEVQLESENGPIIVKNCIVLLLSPRENVVRDRIESLPPLSL